MVDTSAGRTDDGDIEAALGRIEAAVRGGETDLSHLGFWRLIRRLKADPELAARWADVAGRIDRAAFEAAVRPRFPVWFGNAVLLVGTAFGGLAVVVAMRAEEEILTGLALVVAAGVWSLTVHDLAHWIVGRLVGIRFVCYFIGGPFPPRPGLKTDYATYLRTPAAARAWMHASGALATKVAPFVALAFWWVTDAPAWAAWACAVLGVFEIATDVLFSRTSSDWKKVARERRIARAVTSGT